MPLKSFLRRRLLSLLQPWLREDPELHLQLGFRHSLAVAENLRFDVSVLNQLFDSPSCLFLKDLTIERVTLRFSPWHSPAFAIEVHGVRVVQAFEFVARCEHFSFSSQFLLLLLYLFIFLVVHGVSLTGVAVWF